MIFPNGILMCGALRKYLVSHDKKTYTINIFNSTFQDWTRHMHSSWHVFNRYIPQIACSNQSHRNVVREYYTCRFANLGLMSTSPLPPHLNECNVNVVSTFCWNWAKDIPYRQQQNNVHVENTCHIGLRQSNKQTPKEEVTSCAYSEDNLRWCFNK